LEQRRCACTHTVFSSVRTLARDVAPNCFKWYVLYVLKLVEVEVIYPVGRMSSSVCRFQAHSNDVTVLVVYSANISQNLRLVEVSEIARRFIGKNKKTIALHLSAEKT